MTNSTPSERPDPGALLGVHDIAERFGVQPNTVSVWQLRHDDFPKPLKTIGRHVRLWWAPDVDDWYESRLWV